MESNFTVFKRWDGAYSFFPIQTFFSLKPETYSSAAIRYIYIYIYSIKKKQKISELRSCHVVNF